MSMKFAFGRLCLAAIVWVSSGLPLPAQPTAGAPQLLPQNQGWAYTRTGRWSGTFKIEDQVAVFAGSRYGFVRGLKVPLDNTDPLHAEAVLKDGQVYVPVSFAAFLTLKTVTAPTPAPDYLRDRWVYDLPRPAYTPPPTARTLPVNGQTWVDFADVGQALGLHVLSDPSGLVCIGRNPDFDFTTHELNVRDSVITAFDTPDKIASAKVALKYLPALPAMVPPPPASNIPRAAYNLTGFNFRLLGSKPPSPGVYPRLLFSPEDIPFLQERVKNNRVMQMSLAAAEALFANSWWDPKTADGQYFAKLAKGEPATETSEGHAASIYSSDVNYPTNCLTSMALFCLLSGDDVHGQMAADALCNYYKAKEAKIDEILSASESEFAFVPALSGYSAAQWQGMDKLVNHLDLGLALDFAGHWMSPEQKDLMRRIIAKATYGRRPTAGNGLSHLLAVTAIEGLPGYDAEAAAADAELAQSFLDFGFDQKGLLTPDGAKAGNLQFQVLAMVVLARRNDNLWGHPHWRNFLAGAEATSPAPAVGPDANDGGPYDTQTIMEFHAFYPDNTQADRVLAHRFPSFNPSALDLTLYSAQLANETSAHMHQLKLRLPGPSYPGFVSSLLYDTDWTPPARGE